MDTIFRGLLQLIASCAATFGFALFMHAPKRAWAPACLIEFLQLFLGRSVDVDDVILNTLGGLLGYLLFCFIPKKLKK